MTLGDSDLDARRPEQNREGSLVAGEAVFVNNGMIFNAKRTDKS